MSWLRPDRYQRREPIWFVGDVLVAVVFVWITVESLRSNAYVDEFGPIEGWSWLLAISPTLLLPLRRLAPASMLAASTLLYMIISAFQGDSNAPLAIPFFAYSVGLTRSTLMSGAMVATAAVAISTSVFYGPGDPILVFIPITFMLFGIGWLVAITIRSNQARAGELADEAAALREQHARVAAQAVADERSRIARELHDAVGHAVNVIVMRAGAARLTATDENTIESFQEIEKVGRSALIDLDHMLGLLHDAGATRAPLEPTRSTTDIARLVEETRAGGADVHFHDQCAGGIDLTVERPTAAAAYRIVQEALTNALKHAGPARIDVSLACTDRHLEVSVVDDGLGAAAPPARGGGRGIAGMTERAHVLGGRLSAGPRDGGGFSVVAYIPRTHRPTRRAAGRSREAAT